MAKIMVTPGSVMAIERTVQSQAAAMEGGVRYGWSSRHADVRCYDVTGRYTGPDEKRKEGF